MSPGSRLFSAIAALILFFICYHAGSEAFERIQEFRKLERIPVSSIQGSLNGVVQLRGTVLNNGKYLQAPKTHAQTLYYRYLVEEEKRDSDGGTSWEEVEQEENGVDFLLRDATGRASVSIEQYLPIISSFTAGAERSSKSFLAIFLLALAMTCFTGGVCAVMIVASQHKVLVFLTSSTMTAFLFLFLFQFGWQTLENEVALMRSGYNDSVEYYNTRIGSFPDNLLARVFGFRRMPFC